MTTLEVNNFIQAKIFFYPTFPWFSDLTSCWEALALASGSVEIASCPKSFWPWLFAEVPLSRDKGCGIELKSWGRKRKTSFSPATAALQGRGESRLRALELSVTSEVAQTPLRCQKSLCVWYREDLALWVCLCFYQDCVLSAAFLVSVALSPPALRKHFPAGHTLPLSWKAGSLPCPHPERSSKGRVFLLLSAIFSRIILQGTCVVNKFLKIRIKNTYLVSSHGCDIWPWGRHERTSSG